MAVSAFFLAMLLSPAFMWAQNPFQAFIFTVPIDCNAGYGYASVSVTGTYQPPLTYLWSNGLTTSNVVLTPGTYTVTVTDANGQTATATATLTLPPQLFLELVAENQICTAVPDGSVTAIPYGGTPPYTYSWSVPPGGTNSSISGLGEGIYTVTVTDAIGCTVVGQDTVYNTDEGLWLMMTPTNITCYGYHNGMLEVSAMSGTQPYTYSWSFPPGGFTKKVNDLGPGTYTVTVTDANGCSASIEGTVTEPPPLGTFVTSTGLSCDSLACATVIVTGGTPGFGILWSTGATTASICNLTVGVYYVTITDANGCIEIDSITISPNPLMLDVTANALSCAGCTVGGSASATASNGTGNYTYLWSSGCTTATCSNLPAGTYTITATDNSTGCTAVTTVLVPSCTPINVQVTVTSQATCAMGGTATASATGGVAPYTYLWDNGQTGPNAVGLLPGVHTVTVTDATGCSAVANFTVTQVAGPSVTVTVVNQASCTNNGVGTATAVVTGGVGPYSYLWDNGVTTATAVNLLPGNHCVTVTDANGCMAVGCATIAPPNIPQPDIDIIGITTCDAGATIIVTVTGGTPPFTYLWSNGATTGTLVGVPPGVVTVTVTDANQCTATASITIDPPQNPNVIISASSNATCTDPGGATAVVIGGVGPYTYLWSNGETTAVAVNFTAAGTYTVTVTDDGGCTGTATVTIGFTDNGVKIGDWVWYDNDQDGFQDPQEAANGVQGVTVMLIEPGPDNIFGNSDDVVVSTAVTDNVGMYMFACVPPGEYILMFSGIPSGYQWTGKDLVGNNCKDSDVNSIGKTDPFTITQGQADNFCFDAGIHTICEQLTYPGEVCCSQTICEGESPATLYETVPPAGGSGAIQYLWMQLLSIGGAPPSWEVIPTATGSSFQPGPLYETSYFRRCARREGCEFFLETGVITITVLPAGSPGCVQFMSNFNVQAAGDYAVQIDWITSPELFQYMYTVEHSTNNEDWVPIATEMGRHNATSSNSYSVLHQTPVVGQNFYRIKRTTTDGAVSYSETRQITLDMSQDETVAVYPNPVTNKLHIKNIAKYDSDVYVDLICLNGKVLERLVIPQGTLQLLDVPMTAYPAGLYFLRIRFGDGKVRTLKVTKF